MPAIDCNFWDTLTGVMLAPAEDGDFYRILKADPYHDEMGRFTSAASEFEGIGRFQAFKDHVKRRFPGTHIRKANSRITANELHVVFTHQFHSKAVAAAAFSSVKSIYEQYDKNNHPDAPTNVWQENSMIHVKQSFKRKEGFQPTPEVDPKELDEQESRLSSPLKSSSHQGGGVSDSRKVVLENGETGIFKPDSGEWHRSGDAFPRGYQTEREAGAWQVAKAVGMTHMVPPTIKANLVDPKTNTATRGSLMKWIPNSISGSSIYGAALRVPPDDLAKAGVFDYVIGNTDRHDSNWRVSPADGKSIDEAQMGSSPLKIHLIDHGLSFPVKGKHRAGNERMIDRLTGMEDNGVTPNLSKAIQPFVDHKEEILSNLKSLGLPKASIDGVEDRIDSLSAVKIPQDVENLYNYKVSGYSSYLPASLEGRMKDMGLKA
jgi:hypothetical protein